MKQSQQIANRFREVMLNGKWVAQTNYKDQLSDLNCQQANTRIGSLNTIALLTFHVDYYIAGLLDVFKGGTLDIRDKYSFDMPPVESEADWHQLRTTMWNNAEQFAQVGERMSDEAVDGAVVERQSGVYRGE
ncbi:MAG: DUF1572 domain-containing protein, partial [Bacteroidota bacterium]